MSYFFAGLIVFIAYFFGTALATYLLQICWNYSLAPTIDVKEITFWQSLGLIVGVNSLLFLHYISLRKTSKE